MDLLSITVAVSFLSAVMMMAAIIYTLTYILSSFSSKSGVMSPKFVLYSLLYFFGSTIFLFMGVEWLRGLARVTDGKPFILNIAASALALNALLHILCGFLTALLYLRGRQVREQES